MPAQNKPGQDKSQQIVIGAVAAVVVFAVLTGTLLAVRLALRPSNEVKEVAKAPEARQLPSPSRLPEEASSPRSWIDSPAKPKPLAAGHRKPIGVLDSPSHDGDGIPLSSLIDGEIVPFDPKILEATEEDIRAQAAAEGNVWKAASEGDVEALKQQIAIGRDIEGHVPEGYPGAGATPLHLAISAGRGEVVKFLVEKGVNLNVKAKDRDGGTPLHWAAAFGRTEIAKGLIEAGADINAKDNHGFTPLDTSNYEPDKAREAKREIGTLLQENGGRSGR